MLNQSERTRRLFVQLETFIVGFFYTLVFIKFSRALYLEPNLPNALYFFDQSLILSFLLVRRPATLVTERPLDFVLAIAGSVMPMLAIPTTGQAVIPTALCEAIMIVGLITHLGAKLSLRRSFGVIPADRGVMTGGSYRFVRHPMYLGYMTVEVGMLLSGPSLWNAVIFGLHWLLLFYRIMAEERVLRTNPGYLAYCKETPYRLIPGIY